MPEAEFEAAVGRDVLQALTAAGLLTRCGGEACLGGRRLVGHDGLHLIVDGGEGADPNAPPQAYLGRDSLFLARTVRRLRAGRALDLCTGPGLLALTLARRAGRTVAYEEDTGALAALAFNRALNGLDEHIEIVGGDVFTRLAKNDPPADLIVSNPPFMPWPATVERVGFAAGGPAGFEFGLDLLRRAALLLRRPQGRLYMLTGAREDMLDGFDAALTAAAADEGLEILLHPIDRTPMADLPDSAGLGPALGARWRAALPGAEAAAFHSFLMVVRPRSPGLVRRAEPSPAVAP